MEPWRVQLSGGDAHAAWDHFIEAYRPLILATIRHTISDYDAVMDVFAHVCAELSADSLARLRAFDERAVHSAKFSSWLVVVVRNQTFDWLRKQNGRPRVRVPAGLTDVGRGIFQLIFIEGCSHLEAYERIHAGPFPDLSFSEFLKSLRLVYQARGSRSGTAPRYPRAPVGLIVDESPAVDQMLEADELKARIREAFELLGSEERLAVQLYVLDELPAAEVARVLGWPSAKSVYNCVYRALGTLRDRLKEEGIDSTSF